MKTTYSSSTKLFKIPRLYLLIITAIFLVIYIALHIKLNKYPHLAISAVFLFAAFSTLRDKSQQLRLGSDVYSSLLGSLILVAAIIAALVKPEVVVMVFLPFISCLGLALLASGISGLKQYRQELFIFFTLIVSRVLLVFLPDISPLTAKFSAFLLWYSSFPITLEGQHLSLPSGGVQVVEECSGLNLITYMLGLSVVSLITFSTRTIKSAPATADHLAATTNKKPTISFNTKDFWHNHWEKLLVPFVAVSIGFIVNGIRVAALAILATHSNREAFKYLHSQEGSLIIVVVAVVLFGLFYNFLLDYVTSPKTNYQLSLNPFNKISSTMRQIQTQSNQTDSSNFSPETQSLSPSWLKSIVLLHFVGYGILLLVLFDLIEIFYPLNLFNSTWEFEVFGQLVETVVVPLIGFILVFYGGVNFRYKWEKYLLPALSWISLFMAISFVLLIPLSIVNTIRIDKDNGAAINAQQELKVTEIRKAEEVLGKVTTDADMSQYLSYFEDLPSDITKSTQLDSTKEKLTKLFNSEKRNIIAQAKATQTQQRQNLVKRSIKWNLGALVSGALLVLIWQGTSWSRK